MNKYLLLFTLLLLSARVESKEGNALFGNANAAMNAQWSFIENKGQVTDQNHQSRKDLDFYLKSNGLSLFVGDGHLQYQFIRLDNKAAIEKASQEQIRLRNSTVKTKIPTPQFTLYRLDMELIGSNTAVQPVATDRQGYYENYYLPQCGTNGITNVHAYHTITYPNVYPNIDWVIYVKDGRVKYDFMLHAGARVADIRIRYNGATGSSLQDGNLVVNTPLGTITEDAPVAWTVDGKQPVACNFVQHGSEWGFATANYSGALVLDPALKWGTYFGGADFTGITPVGGMGAGICTGKENIEKGKLYTTGLTSSTSLIATTGAYQTAFAGMDDAFLAKFDANGALVWGTYYGGTDEDFGQNVATDIYGYVYMAGLTLSPSGVATSNGHSDVLLVPGYNVFLVQFDTAGHRHWGTYYGETPDDVESYVVTDKHGGVYLSSTTRETTGIATPGAYMETSPANVTEYVSFLAKFDTSGRRHWGTYLGGAGGYTMTDGGIAIDGNEQVYIAGRTAATTNIASTGTYQIVPAGGAYDAYLVKFDTGGTYKWGSYFGGPDEDGLYAVSTDVDNNIYIGGPTYSATGVAASGTSRATSTGAGEFGPDCYLAKFSDDGKLVWSTYTGPVLGIAMVMSITADNCGNPYLAGITLGYSDILPTPDAYHSFYRGGSGFFIINSVLMRYASGDGTMEYSTYFGEPSDTRINTMCVDTKGNLYLTGITSSDSVMGTPGTHQDTLGGVGAYNVFVTKFLDVNISFDFPDTAFCAGGVFTIPYTASSDFNNGNMFKVELSDDTGVFNYTTPNIIGTATANSSGTITCTIPGGLAPGNYRIRILGTDPSVVGSCWRSITILAHGDSAKINANGFTLGTTIPFTTYQWYKDGQPISGATSSTYTVTKNGSYTVVVTQNNGCTDTSGAFVITNIGVANAQLTASDVKIYPNPANTMVHIASVAKVDVSIINMEGRCLIQAKAANSIDISHLAAGIYTMKIADENGLVLKVEKLVKVNE